VIGTALWGAGLFTIGGLIASSAFGRHPRASFFVHEVILFPHPHASLALAGLFVLLGFWQLRKGLSSLHDLRARLSSVRDGRDHRVEGRYPAEVAPLVSELNTLLDQREQAVRRAVAKAGDLAHGLKTPLAVLADDAARAAAAGHRELAASIGQEVGRMRRQVDYHLAQARAAASGAAPGVHCAVVESAEPLARTLLRLHADRASTAREQQGGAEGGRGAATSGHGVATEARGLTIDVHVAAEHTFRGQREDLDEMLGNLLDNACKWARSRVALASSTRDGVVIITIDDDGPGLDASMRQAVLLRGVRADQAAPGSGLGLAIVRDLAELYGGSIALDTSPLGGLRARLQLPSAAVRD
jgi:signal transduction histidine kinase